MRPLCKSPDGCYKPVGRLFFVPLGVLMAIVSGRSVYGMLMDSVSSTEPKVGESPMTI